MENMTTAESIHVYQNSRLQSESFTPEAVTAAYVAGLEAMREKAERENPAPLTPAEIQQMRGRPVWCPEIEAYGIISIDRIGAWKDEPFLRQGLGNIADGHRDGPPGLERERHHRYAGADRTRRSGGPDGHRDGPPLP